MKKALKIIGITLLVILIILFAAPYLFESQLKDLVKKTVNNNVNAKVEFSDISLSLFRNFPQATLVLNDVSVINNAPFAGDTLATGREVSLEMSLGELFKGSEKPKKIDDLNLDQAYVNILVDSLGNANYDIAKENPETASNKASANKETNGGGFSLDLEHYEIKNSRLKYSDAASKISLDLQELNHSGTGDFSLDQTNLDTKTTAQVSFNLDSTNYLNKNKVTLDALIKMDLKNMKYTFLENKATINQLPLKFDGYVQLKEEGTDVNLSFKTPSSDFKNFLGVVPEVYAKNIENVETTGDFTLNGKINGRVDETHIPQLDIKVSSNNASFKYPNLPKSVQDINLDLQILNTSGIAEDTYLTFDDVSFRIDQDRFNAKGSVKNLMGNMLVDLALKGKVNLANIGKAYPLDLDMDLNGNLAVDATTNFDMNSIEKEQYQNVKSNGTANLTNFSYTSPEIPNEIKIASAKINLNQGNVKVPEFKMTTGQTDLEATGTIQNLMGFLFTDQQLKGDFQANSNTFSVNDFMVAQTEENLKGKTSEENSKETAKEKPKTSGEEAVKIPSFLDVQLAFNANKVLYDNLILKNVKGKLILRDETASLQNVSSDIFGGSIGLNGEVSTKNETPNFKMDLNLNRLDIAESFQGLDLLKNLAPIVGALTGKLQTNLDLKGNLNKNLTPQLNTLAGNALAEILSADVNTQKMQLLSKLDQQLDFLDLDKLSLNDVKTKLSFDNGKVKIAPFDFMVKGIKVNVSGTHSFDMNMDYNLTLAVPAEYLGNQFGSTLGKLSGQSLQNTTVPLPVGLSGTFQNPSIKLNMQQAVNNLTQQIIAGQKESLKEKGTQALTDLIGGNKNEKAEDSTQTNPKQQKEEQVKKAAENILGGLLKGRKKKKDSTQN